MKSQNTKQERIAVFILGNGFDLAHGLNTKYTDFLAACHKEELQKNTWFIHFNNQKDKIGKNWFNLEQEIYNFIMNEEGLMESLYHSTPKEKVKERTNELYEGTKEHSLRFFVDQFGEYLLEQLKNPDLTSKQKFQTFLENEILYDNKEYNKIMVVNFNYTNTFEKLYSEYPKKKGITDIMYYHIHGSLNKNDLVLGTQDLPNKDDPFRIFTKENQRFRYNTNEDYQKLLNELKGLGKTNRKSITFHIIGHSLDKADHKILNKILCYSGSEGNIGDIKIYRYEGNESLEIQKNMEEILQYTSFAERVSLTPLEDII